MDNDCVMCVIAGWKTNLTVSHIKDSIEAENTAQAIVFLQGLRKDVDVVTSCGALTEGHKDSILDSIDATLNSVDNGDWELAYTRFMKARKILAYELTKQYR